MEHKVALAMCRYSITRCHVLQCFRELFTEAVNENMFSEFNVKIHSSYDKNASAMKSGHFLLS